ncbi:MAG TPA: DUF3443 domain-containing protein [Burkholderiales bacterium]|nr:DUF3443 domain-containing protein [Burkholderiales bacterium]
MKVEKASVWAISVASIATLLLATGCGGGGGGTDTPPFGVPSGPNVQAISVEPGPANNVNLLFTSVTICAPGNSSNCQTIDHVLVDTGSTGLRIMSSVLSPLLSLPQQLGAGGNPVAECGHFASGFTWGPVKLADVRMAGEEAGSVPIQVIGDPAFSTVPAGCSGVGPPLNTVQDLGANGLLGVGLFQADCGPACASGASIPPVYFTCPSAVCQPTLISLTQQVQNPVGMFLRDNNGVIIALPSVPAAGARSLTGALVFGIGTQGNNGLGNSQVIPVNPNNGTFTTVLNQRSYGTSFTDSGSNALFFDSGIAVCGTFVGFYCPASTQNLSATIQGTSGPPSTVNFRVANAQSLFTANPTFAVFGNLAGPMSNPTSFDWGLPFFFGRNVFTAIEGQNTPAGPGPYVAF